MKSELEIKKCLSTIQSSLSVDALVTSCQTALKAHPGSADLWNIYGEAMEYLDCLHEAELAYQQSVSLEPGNASIWNRLGLLLQKDGRTADSESSFLKAILVDPNFPNLREDSRAVSIEQDTRLLLLHNGSQPKNNRHQLLKTFDTSVWLSVVDEFLKEGEKTRAGRILETAYRIHPNDQPICLQYASMLEQLCRYADASLVIKRLVEVYPDDAEAWHRLALIEYMEGNEEAAVVASRTAVTLTLTNQYKQRLALLLDEQGKTVEAIEVLSKASDPDGATLNLLGVLQHKSGRKEEAQITYEEALRVGGADSFIHNNLGRLLEDMGDEEAAAWAFDKALELDRFNAVAWNNFGVALRRQEFFLEAEKAFRLSISIAPYFKNPWLNLRDLSFSVPSVKTTIVSDFKFSDPSPSRWTQLGWNVFDEMHFSRQLKNLRNQIEPQPENANTLHQLSLCMFNARLYQEANDLLRRSIALYEENASCWNLLGIICEKLNNTDDSIACYQRAIHYDNNYIGAMFNLIEAQLICNEERHPEFSLSKLAS